MLYDNDLDDIEVEDFDQVTDTKKPPRSSSPKPYRPGRLYVTGIVTGILLVTLVLLICDIAGWHPFSTTPAADKAYELEKTIESYIDRYYWKSDTSDEEFANMAAKGMVTALGDPYSLYMTEEELTRTREKNDGDYAGIGAAIGEDEASGRKYITQVEADTPAEKAGLQVGDEVLQVDGVSAAGISLDDLVSMIRGTSGVSHEFKVFRPYTTVSGSAITSGGGSEATSGEELTITVTTDTIVNKSVNHQMLKDNIGYLQITTYDRETPDQFKNALDDLKNQGMKALILDVRNNGGGVLSSVLNILDQLLPAGTLLTETHKGAKDTIYKSTDDEHLDIPMTVLINGYSASASEVFAGALQDRKSIPLVGETSYGKGIVQSIYTLPHELGGIKLTTGEYLLPSGRSIHETGLTPDVAVVFDGEASDYGTDNDNQLARAIELMEEAVGG